MDTFIIYIIFSRMRELETKSKVRRNPPLRRGRVSPRLLVPDHIARPPYVESGVLPDIASEFQIPGPEGLVKMKAACELAARVLNFAGTLVKVKRFFFFFKASSVRLRTE